MTTDYNTRAAKGQALNLAVQDSLITGNSTDVKYILDKFLHYFKLSELVQGATIEEIGKEIKR